MSTTHEQETKARLRELVKRGRQDYAQKWDFNERAEIAGIVESIDVIVFKDDNGDDKPTPVATVRDEFTGERLSIWLSQAALFNRFRDLAIVPGELVYVRYLGESEHHERGKSPAKRFRVEVDRQGAGSFDWSRLGGQPQVVRNGQVVELESAELSTEEHAAAMAAYADEHAPTPTDDDIPF